MRGYINPAAPPLAFGVAGNSNRTNTQGAAPVSPLTRGSRYVSNVIPALGTLPVPVTGNQFYVTATSAPIEIRPSGGSKNRYYTGTGLLVPLENAFELLEISNPNNFQIAFEIFYGFDTFIDKRLIVSQQENPQIAYPTYTTPSSAALVDIIDKSGQLIADINGGEWYAIQRQAIIVCNTDSGVTLLLQKANSVVANGPAIAAIYPLTSLNYPVEGDYRLHLGGANINAVVSEIYSAIPKVRV